MEKSYQIGGVPLDTHDKMIPKYCTHIAIRKLSNDHLLLTLVYSDPVEKEEDAPKLPASGSVIETILIDNKHASKIVETLKSVLDGKIQK